MFIYKENNPIREADFLFVAEEFDGGSSSYTEDFTEGKKLVYQSKTKVKVMILFLKKVYSERKNKIFKIPKLQWQT